MTNFIIISIIANSIFCLFFSRISNFLNIFDKPDSDKKLHKKNVAAIGGVLFFINLIIFLFYLILFDKFLYDYRLKFLNGNKQHFSFFFILTLIFLIGILDDKINLSALKKSIFFTVILIISTIDSNIAIRFLSFEFLSYKVFLSHLGIFFSIISIFYFMNAINMFDGINIQTPLYLLLLFSFLIFFKNENIVIFLLIPSIFFLILNIRGKCFLGNSGSYFLGFLISIILIKINQANPNMIKSEEVLIILSLPCFELCRLFIERILKEKNPFSGDRNHIHHLLSKKFNNLTTSLVTNGFIFLPLIISQFFNFKIFFFIFQFILYCLLIYKLKKV